MTETNENEVITLKREDRLKDNINNDNFDYINSNNNIKNEDIGINNGPRIIFRKIIIPNIGPMEDIPDLGPIPLITHIMNEIHDNTINNTMNDNDDNGQFIKGGHKHKNKHKTNTFNIIDDMKNIDDNLLTKFYGLLMCLVVLITITSIVCLKLYNIHYLLNNSTNSVKSS